MDLLKIEFLKLKKTLMLFMAVIIPIVIVMLFTLKIKTIGSIGGVSLNDELFMFSSITYVSLVLPLLNIYTASNITKVEHDNWGWRQIMLMPIKKSSIYFSKYKVMTITLCGSILSYIFCIALGGAYLSKDINLMIIPVGLQLFITILPIMILLFIIGRNFSSIIPVISVGVIMLITNIFIAQSSFWIYCPWTYSVAVVAGNISSLERIVVLGASLVLSMGMFIIDFINFTKSDII